MSLTGTDQPALDALEYFGAQEPRLINLEAFSPGYVDDLLFAQKFWIAHADLLPANNGVIAQLGEMPDGSLVSLDEAGHTHTITLALDSSRHNEGVFAWQLTRARPSAGYEVSQLVVSPGRSNAARQHFDSQGRLTKTERINVEHLDAEIRGIATSDAVQETSMELRQMRIEAEDSLARFVVGQIFTLSPQKYEAELQAQQARVKSIGFASLPFELFLNKAS